MKLKWKIFHTIAYSLAVFYLGFFIGYEVLRPLPVEIVREVPVEVIRYVPTEVIKEVPMVKTVVVDRPVETIIYTNIYSRRWDNLQQFIDWYQAQNFTALWAADCNDYALAVQETALEQGYPVSIALTINGTYLTTTVTDIPEAHAGILILAGNDYYWVEPQPQWFSYTLVAQRK